MDDGQTQPLTAANEGQVPQLAELVALIDRAQELSAALQTIASDAQAQNSSFVQAVQGANARMAELENLVAQTQQRDAETLQQASAAGESIRAAIDTLEQATKAAQEGAEGALAQFSEKASASVAQIDGIATEARQRVDQLVASSNEQVQNRIGEINTAVQQTAQMRAQSEGSASEAVMLLAQARQTVSEIDAAKAEVGAHRTVTAEASAAKEKFDRDAASAVLKFEEALHDARVQYEEFKVSCDATREDIARLTKEAEAMLFGATNAGLATAFSAEVKALERKMFWASFFFLVGIAALFASLASLYFFMSAILAGHQFTPLDLAVGVFIRTAIVVPAAWVCYFFQRQAFDLFELRQQYVHKASLAASVEPFRRQAGEHAAMAVSGVLTEIMKNPASALKRNRKRNGGTAEDSIDETVKRVLNAMRSGEP